MIETERKFLVESDIFRQEAYESSRITQGFLNRDPERTVRLRIRDKKGYLTVKGKSSEDGLSRFEWEKEIPLKDARDLMGLCEPGLIEKTRYLVKAGNYILEVDEFYGDNRGLILAEVELPFLTETFPKPDWLGLEVTGDNRYYNSQLSKNPIKNWKEK